MDTRSPRKPRTVGDRRPNTPTVEPGRHTGRATPTEQVPAKPPEERHLEGLDERRVVRPRPGEAYVRIVRRFHRQFRRRGPGYYEATEQVLAPKGPLGQLMDGARRFLIGGRIATARQMDERVGIGRGLAIFAPDNISSSAYATEEIMRVLVLAGAGALVATLPITLVIIGVLAIVVTSYQQTIRAYPSGGGSYTVASDNLGSLAGLTAAAALLTDYILTVAVSIAAGVAALTSIFPGLFDFRVVIGVTLVVLICIGNLRGIRESGTIFAVPAYLYLITIMALLLYGMVRFAFGGLPVYQAPPEWRPIEGAELLGPLLLLRAFASGSVALTGVEAVSNGVSAFQPPESRNARTVLIVMGTFFGVIFLGMSFLAAHLGILPDPSEQKTVVSQLAAVLVGEGTPLHYLVQLSTATLLALAANTAFAGFPWLASVLGRDRFVPRQFRHRGDRLAFSTGILVLAIVAAGLIVGFGGSVTNLIPLYTVGVFIAFTLSQLGMVRRWWRLRDAEAGWQWRAGVNGLGAIATGLVAVVVGSAKFALGAWVVLVLIPILVAIMMTIQRHYNEVEDALTLERPDAPLAPPPHPQVVVPVSRLDRAALRALAFARSISTDVTAVHVTDDPEEAEATKRLWASWGENIPLVVVESPYRALIPPLLAYLDAIDSHNPNRPVTVLLPEFVPRRVWEYFLHNQTAFRLKLRLFFRPNTIVIDVPYHLGDAAEPVLAVPRAR